MHVDDWMYHRRFNDPERTLSPLKDGLAHWDSQMPSLDSITVSIYLSFEGLDLAVERQNIEDTLRDFVSVPKLKELKVITMKSADWWDAKLEPDSKRLLVHWTPSDARKPTLIDHPEPYVETCCECLDYFDCGSDDSSSHPGDDDGDDGNDSEKSDGSEESDGDFESDDERSGAANGSHVDADRGDDENAEHADRDSSEDSDGMSSGGEDTTPDSQTT